MYMPMSVSNRACFPFRVVHIYNAWCQVGGTLATRESTDGTVNRDWWAHSGNKWRALASTPWIMNTFLPNDNRAGIY